MRIGIDMMGGDFAPEATIEGSILARQALPAETEIILIGDTEVIRRTADEKGFDISGFVIINTPAVVGMGDNPLKAFKEKADSSMYEGMRMLRRGEIDGFCSAGNTGAMMVGAMQIVTPIPGIIRPAISIIVPNLSGNNSILLDIGLNPDAKPEVLYQYGILGSIYAGIIKGCKEPTVSLMNIGSEEEKGNLVMKSAYQMMKDSRDFNFIGNMEADQLFEFRSDVIVCDGVVGNIMVKEAEAFFRLAAKKGECLDFFEMFNFEKYGGTIVLGVAAPVVIGHGNSRGTAIRQMILQTNTVANAGMANSIKEALNK